MNAELHISVIIATYDRAQILRETMEALTRLDRDGLTVEFVVIDNNSSDDTRQVVESFADCLPIRYLFEPRQGKSCALNMALDRRQLGQIVVFTDDDVAPREDWLQIIVRTTGQYAEYSVFGGKVESWWPDEKPPEWWTRALSTSGWNLSGHCLGDSIQPYPDHRLPPGPNTWVRREVLAKGYRFDESMGPKGRGRSIRVGQDGVFMRRLRADGYRMLYSPDAVVAHRIQPELTTARGIRRRVYSLGRGAPHWAGLCRRELYDSHPVLWRLLRVGALMWAVARRGRAMLFFSPDVRIAESLGPINDIAYNLASLQFANRERRGLGPLRQRQGAEELG